MTAKLQIFFHSRNFFSVFFLFLHFFLYFCSKFERPMQKNILFLVPFVLLACTHRPSKVEMMRQQKAIQDSITYCNAKQNVIYSDSILHALIPQTDTLLRSFVYSKDEKAEDHGHYVHKLLQTTRNAERNFIQAYVMDNYMVRVQSYYYGGHQHGQSAVRFSCGEDYVEKEGSNHVFNAEGWHEILTIEGKDALQLLSLISNHVNDRILVTSIGKQDIRYYLSENERKALHQTYLLAVAMRNINTLERAINVSNRQIEKYEKKHAKAK